MSTSEYANCPKPTVFKLAVNVCAVKPIVISVGVIDPTPAVNVCEDNPIAISVGEIDPTVAAKLTPDISTNCTELGVISATAAVANVTPLIHTTSAGKIEPTRAVVVKLAKPCVWSAPLFILKVPNPVPMVTPLTPKIIS